jgi:hypothetical protein
MTAAAVQTPNAPSLPAEPERKGPRRRRVPSLGFVTVCATYLAVAGFLAWGLRAPDLDRVWTLHHQLKAGELGAPRGKERDLLRGALLRHRELARALLSGGEIGLISAHSDGWITTPEATIVRIAAAHERVLRLDVETPRDLLPFEVDVNGGDFRKQLAVTRHGTYDVLLPAPQKAADLIIVRLKGRDLRDDPSVLGVRISFAAEPSR